MKEMHADPLRFRVRSLSCQYGSRSPEPRVGCGGERKRVDRLKTGREKAEERREAKLETVREQVQNGSLVIRQMTDEERRRYPPRPVDTKRVGKR
jgi:hypothetical protein